MSGPSSCRRCSRSRSSTRRARSTASFSIHHHSFGEASSFFPEIDGYNTGADAYLALIEAARDSVDVPVIASLNGTNIGGWLRYARLLEDAGADAMELNLYAIAADPAQSAALRSKPSNSNSSPSSATRCRSRSRSRSRPTTPRSPPSPSASRRPAPTGIVMFNRFYLPDLDLDTLDVEPRISLSTQAELRLPLRWIGIVRDYLSISLAGSTGVHTGSDAAKLLLAGADVAMTTSALLHHGPGRVAGITDELREWMSEHHYHSVDEMRGAVSREASADPAAYERANYIGNLTSYTSRFIGATPPAVRRT